MKTWISDSFPLHLLECQYYDICLAYDPGKCQYSDECQGYLIIDRDKRVRIRDILRKSLEDFVGVDTLSYEIQLIIKENGKKQKKR